MNILKGFIIGVLKIVPGVSGSMMAISLGVYEQALAIIANLHQINLKKFLFIFSLGIGIFLGVCLFSHVLEWLLSNFYFPIMLLFIGLISGGLPNFTLDFTHKPFKKRYIVIFILSLLLFYNFIVIFSFFHVDNLEGNYFVYFFLGLIEVFSSIVPGISGTAIFMSLGCYEILLDFFSNFFKAKYYSFGIFFSLGIILGMIFLSKIITFLFKKYRIYMNIVIFGFMISSISIMVLDVFSKSFGFLDLLVGIILFLIGYRIVSVIN